MSFKALIDRRFLREGGREFQIDDPENARLVLYRSTPGRGGIKLFEAYLLVDLAKSEYFKHHYRLVVY